MIFLKTPTYDIGIRSHAVVFAATVALSNADKWTQGAIGSLRTLDILDRFVRELSFQL